MSIETLKQLVAALEYHTAQTRPITQTQEAIAAGKAAIEQTENQDQIRAITQEAHQKINDLEDEIRRKFYGIPPAAPVQECLAHGECFGGKCIYTTPPAQPAPVQEPVAVVDANDEGYWADILPDRTVKVGQFLYAAAQRPWVGLTDEERVGLWKATETDNRMVLIDAVEAQLKELNA
jgi:hypothetical protein